MATNRIFQKRPSLEGNLLVASPQWHHELFGESVCLIVQHSLQGAVGVFLNRSLEFDPQLLWEHLGGQSPPAKQTSILFGGPQSGPVVALHDCRELAEFSGGDGVYFAAQVQVLQQLITATHGHKSHVKIIVGQADWSAGELDQQCLEGKWLPLPVSSKLVFAEREQMWFRAIREVGNQFVASITSAHGQPDDVLSN